MAGARSGDNPSEGCPLGVVLMLHRENSVRAASVPLPLTVHNVLILLSSVYMHEVM